MAVTGDVGPQVLKFLFDAPKIDDAWALRERRSFTWWAHRLARRVWAEPARSSYDHDVVRVHAATAVLRGASDTADLRARLATTNRFMSLGALVASQAGDRIVLHSAGCFHTQNVAWLQPLFLAAVGIQVADADIKADGLAGLLEPDVSAHPRSGTRPAPDEILGVIATVIAPGGEGVSRWTEGDFKATSDMRPRPWVLATSGAGGMTAEFPFTGDLPAAMAPGPETALLTVSSTERHPQLGSGLLLRLQLPFSVSKEQGADLAWMLNVLEMTSRTNAHALGAWCLGPAPPGRPDAHSVTFVSFVPAVAYRRGLLDVMAMDMAIRTRWVARVLLGEGRTKASTPEELAEPLRRASEPQHLEQLREILRVGSEAIQAEATERAAEVEKASELGRRRPTPDTVPCWACRAPLTVTAETRGKKVRCPPCGTKQAVPR